MDLVSKIMAYEQGDLDAEGTVGLFAELIKSGQAWQLQGSYGRAASGLIQRGIISPEGVIDEAALAAALED